MKPHPGLWAILPVKPFKSGKSRLAPVLDAAGRTALCRQMFDHVFDVALAAFGPTRVAVVTADIALAGWVSGRGAHAVVEGAAGNLNDALDEACRYATARGAQAVLVLPSDLPFVTAGDVAALHTAIGSAPSVVIAPDAAEQATNALVVAPPDPEFFRFGPSSFAAHVEASRSRVASLRIVRRPGLAFDLDTPEDYRVYSTRRALATKAEEFEAMTGSKA